ncbi:MAG: methenyltetrahydromethanopterin cyclohydrolase [Azospirillum sp.]|nr:methenyltetrahydromethanopterin cyclohydrolase [Azospirillum sp.]
MNTEDWPSLAALSQPLVERLLVDADALGLIVERQEGTGAVLVDGGIAARGGLEAGRRIAELCLGGLGSVTLTGHGRLADWPLAVSAATAYPVPACLASQYAGWALSEGAYFALASGPGRALAAVEPLFQEFGWRDRGSHACLVLETAAPPPPALVERVAEGCGVAPDRLTFVMTPTTSLAGAVQIAARVLEVALHKAHTLGFALARIADGIGSAPLPPPSPDFVTAMGRTNDAILYGGEVHLFVSGPEDDAQALADRLPSSTSRDYGRPFAEVFGQYDGDFYAIDPLLFSPARVIVTALGSGRSFRRGAIDAPLIDRSFGHGV